MRNISIGFSKFFMLFAFVALLASTGMSQTSLRKALDFDGDSKADFAVFRPSNNSWYIQRSTSGFMAQQFGDYNTDFLTPGDYDGDGKGDVAVWRDTNGAWYRMNSSNNTFNAYIFGTIGDEPVARDYDGDGKTDIAVVRRSGGVITWYVAKSSDSSFFSAQFGSATLDCVAPGDYDGDGKFDLAVQRNGCAELNRTQPATFYILKSSDSTILSYVWGFGGDFVVPGDYDGDRKTDIAVVREGATDTDALIWYIRRSSDGGLTAVAFGATGTDQTTQNDYDGDGKTDISVWRDSNGFFYYLRSSDGALGGYQFGLGSDVPVAQYDTH